MFIFLIFIALIVLMGKHIYEIHNYNNEVVMEQLQSANKDDIFEKIKERKPLLIHNLGSKHEDFVSLSFDSLIKGNPGHIIHDNNKFIALRSFRDNDVKQMSIYKNPMLYSQFSLKSGYDEVYECFKSNIHCNVNYYLSLFLGSNAISLQKSKHNLHLIHQISGKSHVYLFNPKHVGDIYGKMNSEIKKYGQKIAMTPGIVVYIPVEWYYFYEMDGESIIGEIEADNYFTALYNYIR
tara:strand:- start:1677 stop:2387 length:711 start_codon:yes stop_codon:yes gene_type:complete